MIWIFAASIVSVIFGFVWGEKFATKMHRRIFFDITAAYLTKNPEHATAFFSTLDDIAKVSASALKRFRGQP